MVGSDTLSHTFSVSHYLLTKTLRARVRVLRTRSCVCSTRLITTKSLERRRRIILRCRRTSKASLPAEEADNQMKMETSSATRFSTFRNPPFHTPPRLNDRKKTTELTRSKGKSALLSKNREGNGPGWRVCLGFSPRQTVVTWYMIVIPWSVRLPEYLSRITLSGHDNKSSLYELRIYACATIDFSRRRGL